MSTFATSQVVLLLVYTENCPEHLGFRTSSHTNHVANLLVTPEFQVYGLVYLFSNLKLSRAESGNQFSMIQRKT